jgi:hypothetical protein
MGTKMIEDRDDCPSLVTWDALLSDAGEQVDNHAKAGAARNALKDEGAEEVGRARPIKSDRARKCDIWDLHGEFAPGSETSQSAFDKCRSAGVAYFMGSLKGQN